MVISDLEKGCLAYIMFCDVDSVPVEYFRIEHIKNIYNLYLTHKSEYQKAPSLEQMVLLIKQAHPDNNATTLTIARGVYDLKEDIEKNKDFYEKSLVNWKKCTLADAELSNLLDLLQHKKGEKAEALIANLYTKLTELNTESKETIHDVQEDYDLISSNDFEFYYTGIEKLDESGGFPVTSHVLINGRRGKGKSCVGLNLLKNMYELNDITTCFISLEMEKSEVKARLLSMISGVSFIRILRNILTDDERLTVFTAFAKFRYLRSEASAINDYISSNRDRLLNLIKTDSKKFFIELNSKFTLRPNKFIIVDDPSLTLDRLSLIVDSLTKNYDLRAFCTDYLQIIRRLGKAEAKDALGDISAEIRRLALRHRLVSILLGQLNAVGTMTANSFSSEAPATVIYSIEDSDAAQQECVLPLHCSKARAIPQVDLMLHINPDTMLITD